MINVHVLKNAWKTQSLLSDHFFQAMHNGPESTKGAARALAKLALKGIPQSNEKLGAFDITIDASARPKG